MPGYLNGWDAFVVFLMYFVVLVLVPIALAVVVTVGTAGAISWAIKRTLPGSRLVRGRMVLGFATIVVAIGLWLSAVNAYRTNQTVAIVVALGVVAATVAWLFVGRLVSASRPPSAGAAKDNQAPAIGQGS